MAFSGRTLPVLPSISVTQPWSLPARSSPSVAPQSFRLGWVELSHGSLQTTNIQLAPLAQALVCIAVCRYRRSRKRQHGNRRACQTLTSRSSYVTGPGWTDELARVFDPREVGPEWQPDLGYRGRPQLRLLLDGEDLVHSYAKALYEHTGQWTGPLSMGIEQALMYGAWRGGVPPDPNPDRSPEDPQLQPPEIMTFVAMPADLIEAVTPGNVCDGYPEQLRKELGKCQFGDEGYFVNAWLADLHEQDRLITWNRPARLPGGAPRPNSLLTQKYYKPGRAMAFRGLKASPIMLSQVMGSGNTLKVGDEVEALKPGRIVQDKWLPSSWERAEVVAVNYDGTYDLQFRMDFGPFWANRKKGLKGMAMLSLRKNEVYRKYGADSMPAKFRMMQELNYAQATSPDRIRLPGGIDRISDTMDTEGNQDWYLCTTRDFVITAATKSPDRNRLEDFRRRFVFSYRWVPTEDGLRFEPVPTDCMAAAIRVNHNDTAQQFADAGTADELAKMKLNMYKESIAQWSDEVKEIKKAKPYEPKPAGPRGRGLLDSPLTPLSTKKERTNPVQELLDM